jgi:plasmid stabilization system protein ParE
MFENVRIRPEAELDLQEAYSYLEQCRVGLGADFMKCVQNALAKVSSNHEHYSIVHKSIRRILVRRFPFAVFYRKVDDIIVVFAVLYCAREPTTWRART